MEGTRGANPGMKKGMPPGFKNNLEFNTLNPEPRI